jgi:hypothetical protein
MTLITIETTAVLKGKSLTRKLYIKRATLLGKLMKNTEAGSVQRRQALFQEGNN